MSGDEPKSAYELAMERLRKQDRDAGRAEAAPLTDAQKKKIAEIRRDAEAKIAQLEIMRQSHLHAAAGDADEFAKIEENSLRDRRRIESERDGRIAKVREGHAG